MEFGETEKEKVNSEVPWIPTTPFKPIAQRPVQICTSGEGNQLNSHFNGEFAFLESSAGGNVNNRLDSEAGTSNIGHDNARTRVQVSFNDIPGPSNSFAELLAQAGAPSAYLNSRYGFLENQFVSGMWNSQFDQSYALLGNHNLYQQQPYTNFVHDNYQDPRGTSYMTYYGQTNSQVALPPENVVTGKDKQVVETQICMDQREHEDNASATMCDKSHNKVYDPVVVDLTSIPTPCKEDNNNNKEIHHIIDLNEIPQTKPKRRKHRPKVIREGKPKKTRKPATPRPDQSKENSTQKRKYVRKKDSNTTPAEVTGERTEPLMPESAKKTCRRSLYFEMPEEPRDGNYACREENATMQFGGETGIEVQETQALNNYMSSREDAQASTSNGKFSSDRSQEVGSKRKPAGAIKQADNGSVNLIGAQYNLLQAYQSRYWVQFPNVQKKRRSEKGKFSNTSNTSSMTATKDVQLATCSEENARSYQGASTSNGWTAASASEYETAKLLTMLRAAESATCDKSQSLEYNLFSGQSRPTKKRSRVTNRAHDYTSLAIIRNCDAKLTNIANQSSSDRKTFEEAQRPQTGIDALVAEMRASLTKKKRSKKRTAPISSVYSSRDEMQQHIPLHSSLGVARGESWKSIYTVDTLTQQFSQLSIYREARELVLYDQNALVTYKQKTEKRKGRRVHEYGTIIPYEGVFDPIKKQRPRPKVDLDEETNKVWKLLMLDINSHGVDGTDEDKAKWWENERNVFRGRAESFIARMHLVQGDRRFSRWKGSVVDSVVGVFLTQNVSDHLSSSAFMSLAARFPVKPSSKYDTCHDESASMIVNSPEVQIVEPEENAKLEEILNQSVHELSSMTKDITEHPEERETVDSNSIDSCGTTGSLKDESNCKMSEPAQRNISEHSTVEFVSPVIGEGQENSCNGVVRKELNALFSSHCSIVTSQLSGDFSIDQNPEKIGSVSDSNTEVEDRLSTAEYNVSNRTSFSNLLGMASSTQLHEVNSQSQRNNLTENLRDPYGQPVATRHDNLEENLEKSNVNQSYIEVITTQCNDYNLKMTPNSEVLEVNCYNPVNVEASSSGSSKNKNEDNISLSSPAESHSLLSQAHLQQHSDHKQHEAFHISGQSQDLMPKSKESDSCDHSYAITNENSKLDSAPVKSKGKKEKKDSFNWDSLRVQALATAGEREKTESTKDSLDWDAVRRANVNEIADAIKERGMNNMLAERIQSFLNLLVDKHGGIDLEWLRDVPPDQAKEFLLSIRGLGLKSVECVRLLTLHHLAFPVDTNVGRIAVRLGWVPLQPLPESLQLHLLELYPVLESIQKYLWPRLCKLDQRTLYELHYQLITFGKVFCTKSKPNCNACPMRGECRHFASAFASARLALPGPEQKNLVIASGNNATDQNPSVIINRSPLPLPEPEQKDIDMTSGNNATDQNPSVIINHLSLPLPEQEQNNIDMTTGNNTTDQNPSVIINQLPLSLPENTNQAEELLQTVVVSQLGTNSEINICQPIIEEPASPEPECSHVSDNDIEDAFYEESDEIPTIKLDLEEFTVNLQNYMQTNMELQEGEMSKALVALNQEAAYIPTPKLKNVSRLRTEHSVYELPDSHCLLEGWEVREPDDPGKYLLAIWTPGETANSIQPPERKCSAQGCGQLCNEEECFSCNSFREASAQMVRGTILIPCRTAMRGSFPLNGTYFQVNEVFADHESSLNPISVPRSWIWNLNRRTVHFGTSIPSIFKGLSTQEIQQCFWRGFVCVRGFDRQTRAPRPLKARLHFPASKLAKNKEQAKKDSKAANSQPQPANSQGLNLKSNTEQQPEFLASLPNLQPNGGS